MPVFKRLVMDRHPHMEWGWYNSVEQFHDWIGGNDDAAPSLRVRLSIKDPKNEEPLLVNASNGLLDPEYLPIMVQLLSSAYEYYRKVKRESYERC